MLALVAALFAACEKNVDELNQDDLMLKKAKVKECVTLQDGTILYSAGHYLAGKPISVGYDVFGYNYQAGLFNGTYANAYLGGAGFPPYEGNDEEYLAENPTAALLSVWPYRDINLEMKWNDAWISNKDCGTQIGREGAFSDPYTPDGKLDRHYPYDSYIGSGAWETNHMSGGIGKDHWTYFVKIVAVPSDAVNNGGVWYTIDGDEIGPDIWGQFAIIQEIDNELGTKYVSPIGPGFGKFKP